MNTLITIADISIRRDAEGRFSLNDLHRAAVASGANERTKEPGKFFSSPQTIDLVSEIETTQILGSLPVNKIEGRNGGTFVCKELVIAYAMWVSPAFHLKVIRAYDQMHAQPGRQELPDFSNPATAARAWAEQFEQREQLALENRVQAEVLAEVTPKAQAFDQIAAGDKALTVTQAAKVLGIKREELTNWLHANGWIYRQNGSWVAYEQHIRNGRLRFKEARYTDDVTGQEVYRPYCHITPKGLTLLAQEFGQRRAA